MARIWDVDVDGTPPSRRIHLRVVSPPRQIRMLPKRYANLGRPELKRKLSTDSLIDGPNPRPVTRPRMEEEASGSSSSVDTTAQPRGPQCVISDPSASSGCSGDNEMKESKRQDWGRIQCFDSSFDPLYDEEYEDPYEGDAQDASEQTLVGQEPPSQPGAGGQDVEMGDETAS